MCWFCEFCSIFVFPVWGKKPPEWWEAGYESILTPTKNNDAGTNLPQKKSINIQQTEITVVKNSQDLGKSLISSYVDVIS